MRLVVLSNAGSSVRFHNGNSSKRALRATSRGTSRCCPEFNSLRDLCVLEVSAVSDFSTCFTSEAQTTQRSRREDFEIGHLICVGVLSVETNHRETANGLAQRAKIQLF